MAKMIYKLNFLLVSKILFILRAVHKFKSIALVPALLIFLNLKGQNRLVKKEIDSASVKTWTYVHTPAISNNGKYAGYLVSQGLRGKTGLQLKSISGNWSKSIPDVTSYNFTSDNRSVVLLSDSGFLKTIFLGSNEEQNLTQVQDFKLFTRNKTEWLIYTTSDLELVLVNRRSHKQYTYHNVTSYIQDKASNRLVLIQKAEKDVSISYLDFIDMKETIIAENISLNHTAIDDTGAQFAWSSNGLIYHYNFQKKIKRTLVDIKNKGLDAETYVAQLNGFSRDGKYLLLRLDYKRTKYTSDKREVEIWSGEDNYLNSLKSDFEEPRPSLYILDLDISDLQRIENLHETTSFSNQRSDRYALIDYLDGDFYESAWNEHGRHKYSFWDIKQGKRIHLDAYPVSISPSNKVVLVQDSLQMEFNLFDIPTWKTVNLTQSLKAFDYQKFVPEYDRKSWQFVGWLGVDHVLLLDHYDLWSFALKPPYTAVNLTNGYGKKNHISFRIAIPREDQIYSQKDIRLLSAFNNDNKDNGFFKLSGDVGYDPTKLLMDDHWYSFPDDIHLRAFPPVKAKDANVWIVLKQDAAHSPNFYTTDDFKTLKPLSEVFPEKQYNWLSSELMTFPIPDGQAVQAILYKPENFDSSKKYPVIINYYETLSGTKNAYIAPDIMGDDINVPWFVSRGYIVCATDIVNHLTVPGESALNSVIGAADALCKLSFVDSNKLAILGHSFGGYETNYIVTHSGRFAAAVSSAGYADLVSAAGSINSGIGINYASYWAELGQGRVGYSIWELPDLYISNSPIFSANKVITPLLMIANEKDNAVNFSQGIEFYLALRRFNKKVWMLSYPDAGHSIVDEKQALDYTNKVTDFLDFYLKNKQKPIWMLKKNE